MTWSPEKLDGLIMSTLMISQVSARLVAIRQNMLFPSVLLLRLWSSLNTSWLVRLSRVDTMARASLLLMGRSALHTRFVFVLSAVRDALRCTGRLTFRCGHSMADTTLLEGKLSRWWHEVLDLELSVLAYGLSVLFSMDRFSLRRCSPQVCVVVHLWVMCPALVPLMVRVRVLASRDVVWLPLTTSVSGTAMVSVVRVR